MNTVTVCLCVNLPSMNVCGLVEDIRCYDAARSVMWQVKLYSYVLDNNGQRSRFLLLQSSSAVHHPQQDNKAVVLQM